MSVHRIFSLTQGMDIVRIITALNAGVAALVLGVGVASAQPLLHYNFDEASSGADPALDQGTGTPAPGSFEGGATRTGNTPGSFSLGAADLSVANTYVTTPDPDKLDGLGPLTLTAWVNLQGAPLHGNRVMSKQVVTGNFDGFSFAFNNPTSGSIAADNFRLNLALGGTGGFGFFLSDQDLSADNQWIFVAATYNGFDTVTFYSGGDAGSATVGSIGGSLVAGVSPGTLVANDRDFRVGAQSEGTISAPVWIDDVRVFSSVLDLAALETVRLANLPEEGLPGDFNQDNIVDAGDYVFWRKNLGTPETYETWRTHFGQTATSSAMLTAVPEPAGIVLLALGVSIIGLPSRRCASGRVLGSVGRRR